MKLRIKSIIITIVFLIFCLISGRFLYESSLFNINEIEWSFNGNEYPLYTTSLQKSFDKSVDFVIGKSIWTVSIYEIEKKLIQLPCIKSVSINRRFPNKLTVTLELKKIVANVIVSPEKIQPVSDDGLLLESVKTTLSPTVPFLVNSEFKKNYELRYEVVNILNKIPHEGLLSLDTISSVEQGRDKTFWFSLKSNQTRVALNGESTEIKVARVNKVLNYLEQNQIKGRVIDANFSKKVLVKLRNHE